MNYHILTAAYLVLSVIVFAWLGMMWSKKSLTDSLIKLFFIAITFCGIVILYKFK